MSQMKRTFFIHTLRSFSDSQAMAFGHFMLLHYKKLREIERKSYILWKSKRWRHFWMCSFLAHLHMNCWIMFVRRTFRFVSLYVSKFWIYAVISLHFIRKWRHGVYICFGFIGNSVCAIIFSFSSPFHWNEPMLVTFRRRLTTNFWLWVYSVYNPKVELWSLSISSFFCVCVCAHSSSLVVDWFRSFL